MTHQPDFYVPAPGTVADIFITPGHSLNGRYRFDMTGACWLRGVEVTTGKVELFIPEFMASYRDRGFLTIVTEA